MTQRNEILVRTVPVVAVDVVDFYPRVFGHPLAAVFAGAGVLSSVIQIPLSVPFAWANATPVPVPF